MGDAESLTVRDNRTGKEYEIPITDGTIKAGDLAQIKVGDGEPIRVIQRKMELLRLPNSAPLVLLSA